MFAFLALLFVLIVIYIFTNTNKINEGFNPVNTSPDHVIKIPANVIPPIIPPPPARSISDKDVQPANLPGSLPIAPYEQIASASPLPYQDPAQIKANRQQLVDTLENLKGFLAFEAQEISERSDPEIQLPLNTARSDFKRLQDEVSVLNRNPGIQPDVTMEQLNDIQSNIAFLQRKVRLIGAAGPIQGPIYEFTKEVEGFQAGEIATQKDLQNFVARLSAEIIRLSASGTTDPVINARIVALTQMKQNVQNIISKVESGALLSTEIPIMKSDIQKAFPILGKPSEPLPQIIKTLGLPPGLGNLLPSNIQKDPQTVREINNLVDKYANDVVNGLSFSVKYTSPREAEIAKTSTVDKTGFPSKSDLENISNIKFKPVDQGSISDVYADKPVDDRRGPSHFDWKARAKAIEAQVRKRGLNPDDFGIMKEDTQVSHDFSWKGYARMICTRLQATMDPSLPETCGCPPMNWKGWKITQY